MPSGPAEQSTPTPTPHVRGKPGYLPTSRSAWMRPWKLLTLQLLPVDLRWCVGKNSLFNPALCITDDSVGELQVGPFIQQEHPLESKPWPSGLTLSRSLSAVPRWSSPLTLMRTGSQALQSLRPENVVCILDSLHERDLSRGVQRCPEAEAPTGSELEDGWMHPRRLNTTLNVHASTFFLFNNESKVYFSLSIALILVHKFLDTYCCLIWVSLITIKIVHFSCFITICHQYFLFYEFPLLILRYFSSLSYFDIHHLLLIYLLCALKIIEHFNFILCCFTFWQRSFIF